LVNFHHIAFSLRLITNMKQSTCRLTASFTRIYPNELSTPLKYETKNKFIIQKFFPYNAHVIHLSPCDYRICIIITITLITILLLLEINSPREIGVEELMKLCWNKSLEEILSLTIYCVKLLMLMQVCRPRRIFSANVTSP